MFLKTLQITIIFYLITLTKQKQVASDDILTKLLQNTDIIDDVWQKLNIKPSNHRTHSRHHAGNAQRNHHLNGRGAHGDDDHQNLMNIQNLNLIVKHNNMRRNKKGSALGEKQTNVTKNLENTLRCGCGRSANIARSNTDDDSVERIVQLLRDYERELEEEEKYSILRYASDSICARKCGCNGRSCNKRNADSNEVEVSIDELRQFLERVDKKLNRNYNKYHTKSNSDKIGYANNDVDVMIVDGSDLDQLLTKLNAAQSTEHSEENSDDIPIISAYTTDSNQNLQDKYLADLENLIFSQRRSFPKDKTVNAEDVVKYYNNIKKEVTNKITDFIRNKNSKQNINFLKTEQKHLLEGIRQRVQDKGADLSDSLLENHITDIVFGKKSTTKILPHSENNDNIYIPSWLYGTLQKLKDRNGLRASKRLLPITTKQRSRMLKRNRNFKSKIWRRNINQDLKSYGLPFELEVRGLGQVNQS